MKERISVLSKLEVCNSLKEAFEVLDTHHMNRRVLGELQYFWSKALKLFPLPQDQKIIWMELTSSRVIVTGPKRFPIVHMINSEGEVLEYPPQELESEFIEHLQIRLDISTNPSLKAHYAHLLWTSSRKHIRHAQTAIENYLKQVDHYLNVHDLDGINFLLTNSLSIAKSARLDSNRFQELVQQVFDLPIDKYLYDIHSVCECVHSFPKYFDDSVKKKVMEFYEAIYAQLKGTSEEHQLANIYLPSACRHAKQQKNDHKPWYGKIGELWFSRAEKENRRDRAFARTIFYERALDAYRASGDKEMQAKCYAAIQDNKQNIHLNNVTLESELSEEASEKYRAIQANKLKQSELLLKKSADEIFQYLSHGEYLPVTPAANRDSAPRLSDLYTHILFDENGNHRIAEKPNFENELAYQFALSQNMGIVIDTILLPSIERGIFTTQSLISYLVNHSWIGANHIRPDLSNGQRPFSWLPLLIPALHELVLQIQVSNAMSEYSGGFVLVLDSLCSKYEGLLRHLFQINEVHTNVKASDGIQERLLNSLLDDEMMESLFSEGERTFFNFLFNNEHGMNLRNKSAHCFGYGDHYTRYSCLLVFLAIMRLNKFAIKM